LEQHKCLGIYWSKNSATAVLASFEGGALQLWNCFTVQQTEPVEGQERQSIAQLISAACMERQLAFSETAIAIDCGTFTQHNVHSDFATPRQIAQTIRFDAEESLAADAAKLAIAFNIVDSDESGSNVCVYSADRAVMMDILADLQNNKFDPVAMEPDSACLTRFIQYAFAPEAGTHPLYAMLGQRFGYFIATGSAPESWPVRTFVIGKNQNRNSLIASQIPMTLAMFNAAESSDSLRLFDSVNSLDVNKAAQDIGLSAQQINLSAVMESVKSDTSQMPDPVDFAIACGAVLGQIIKTRVDFRQDFMPYQGKRVMLEKTLKALSISVTLMLLAVGIFFQLRLFTSNRYLGQLRQNLKTEYTAVFAGKTPSSTADAISNLNRELIRVQKVKSGQISASGEASVSALLTYVIEALNKTPPNVQVNFDYITVSPKTVIVAGDTGSHDNTLALFNAFDSHPHIKTSQSSFDFKSNRDQFRVTILPKEGSKK
jgi:hypothetical protein